MAAAELKRKIEVPLKKGTKTIKIEEGTKNGTIIRVKGEGCKILNRESYGDLVLTIKSEIPKNLGKKARALLEEIEEEFDDDDYPKYKEFKKKMKN